MELSQDRVALDVGVHARRINEIVLGKRAITANTALRLARYFETTPQFWLSRHVRRYDHPWIWYRSVQEVVPWIF